MKYMFYLILVFVFVSCNSGNKNTEAQKATAQMVETTINIGGMHCDMCVASVTKGVSELKGVTAVEVSLTDSLAVVSYDAKKVGLPEIEKAIEKRGYIIKGEIQ